MKNWNIGKRITFGFCAVLVMILILGAFTLRQISTVRAQFNLVADTAVPALKHIADVDTRAQEIQGLVYKHIYSPNNDDMAKLEGIMEAEHQKNSEDMAAYEKLVDDGNTRQLLEKLKTARNKYWDMRNEIIKASHAATNAEASSALCAHARADFDPLMADYLKILDQMSETETRAVADASTATAATIRSSNLGVSCGVVGALLIGSFLAYFIVRGLNRVLSRVSRAIGDGAEQVVSAAGQVGSSSQSLAEGASEQAASIEETSSSLEEMSSMTKRNADNSQQANNIAKQTRAAADKGVADMTAMSAAMGDIKQSSDDVAKIIKTIDEIAFQTNILALNAAVEAARAGEAGMGFAVVADEVRNLAQRSAQAAKETASRIEGAITKTAQGVQLSIKVSEALNEIVTKARQMDELAAGVASASSEQAQGIGQVNAAVGQMDAYILWRRAAINVPVGKHVEVAVPLDDDARTRFLVAIQCFERGAFVAPET